MRTSLSKIGRLIPVFFLVVGLKGLGQIPTGPVNFQSPNAATMGLFGEIPVSHFTGLPQIQVPLYTFEDNGITIPLSLDYHASGFRPDMHPGWVGLGWNFSGTYAITRTINDAPDDYSHNIYGYLSATGGYYFNKGVLNTSNWNQIAYMQSIARTDSSRKDTEPDEYSFSFPGGSGKFYLDHTGEWRVKCDKPVKVSFDSTFLSVPITPPSGTWQQANGNTHSFSGFSITDEWGTRYVYGMTTDAIEYNVPFFDQGETQESQWIANAWYLTKIITQDGREVDFSYQRDDFVNQMYLSLTNNIETRVSADGVIFELVSPCNAYSFYDVHMSYDGRLISPVYLKNISGPNVSVDFVRSTSVELTYPQVAYEYRKDQFRLLSMGPFLPQLNNTGGSNFQGLSELKFKKLDSIKVKSTDNSIRRIFVMEYNNDSTERLMLKAVKEVGADSVEKPPYRFYYDTSVTMPPYLANKNDHWGFYNGTEATLIGSSYYLTYYNKREPKEEYLYAGTLNRIIYPTGGVTEFVYEPHTYRKRLSEIRHYGIDPYYSVNTIAGGLRIKKIFSYDINVDSVKKTKEYDYHVGPGSNVSTGILGGRIRYYFDDYRTVSFNYLNHIYSNSLFSSQSVLPGGVNAAGCHVGYSKVREKLANGSYTDYYFTNFDSGYVDDGADTTLQLSKTAYQPYASREEERGKLFREEVYRADDVLLTKREIFHDTLNKSNEYVRALKCMNYVGCFGGSSLSVEEGTAYRIYTYSFVPVQERITQYNQGGTNPVVTNKYFRYDPEHRLVVKDSTWDSKGQNVQTYYRYPFTVLNYTVSGTAPNTNPVGYMVQKNIIGTPLEVVQTRNISGSEYVIGSKLTEYDGFHSFVKPHREYHFKHPANGVLKSAYTDYSVALSGPNESPTKDNRLELRRTYEAYDDRGNLTDYSNDQDLKEAFQWDYDKTRPTTKVAIAAPTAGKEYFYQGFEEDETAATATPFAGKRYKLGDYTVPYSAPNGKTYFVNYYSLQSGAWVKITKQFFNHLNLTEGDAIDEVRVYPADGQISSYTYDPINGMTSEADINGNTRLYDYDGLGRLTAVRDEKRNIIKQFAYQYQWWQPTGTSQCKTCPSNPLSISNILQVQYRDNDPSSPTYNQTRWIDAGASSACVPPPQWQNTATPLRCKKNHIYQNTGEREQEQRDMNACSGSYLQTRWVLADTNTTACPLPLTTILLTTSGSFSGSNMVFESLSNGNQYVFNLYPGVTNYVSGQIPYDMYDVRMQAFGNYAFQVGNYYQTGFSFEATMAIGGPTLNVTIN